MNEPSSHTRTALALLVAAMLASGSAFGDKPSSAGKGGGGKHQQDDGRDNHREGAHFADQHRSVANDYYSRQFQSGRCPPGLAKKDNGCLPPGQAKQFVVGQALPRNVTYYNVPSSLVSQLPPAPAGYRYVRVDNDVLLMSPSTRMVRDALRNLGAS